MTRILCWNIERFGINKLGINDWDLNGSRRKHILSTVKEANAPEMGGLDVFIVIEVQTPAGFGGLIYGESGPAGVMTLLQALQGADSAAGWSLVPPLVTSTVDGYSEGVAVFFKSKTLNFIGPMMWDSREGAIPEAGKGIAYAGDWLGALPATPSLRPGGGFTQDQLAGKVKFYDATNAFIYFPEPFTRSLWMTQFFNPISKRYLSLFAVHFPPADRYQHPPDAMAQQAFSNLALVPEIIGGPVFGGPEDRVVIGDFNINSLDPARATVLQHLNAHHYTMAFGSANLQPTAIQSVDTASTTGAYPFYNYGSTTIGGLHLGLDNIFVHRSGAPAPAAPQFSVVNRVVGTPAGYGVDMVTDIPTINATLPSGGARSSHFRTLANYGHIGGAGGASDHLAVCVELP